MEHVGRTCPYCQSVIKPGTAVQVCNRCLIPHHEECWQANGGCTTYGCSRATGPTPFADTVRRSPGAHRQSGVAGTPLIHRIGRREGIALAALLLVAILVAVWIVSSHRGAERTQLVPRYPPPPVAGHSTGVTPEAGDMIPTEPSEECSGCGGRGTITCSPCRGTGRCGYCSYSYGGRRCSVCGGSRICYYCGGLGHLQCARCGGTGTAY